MGRMLVREVVFTGQNEVDIRSREADLTPGPRQVLLRTLYSFVSTGTERAKLTGLQKISYPWVAGNRAVAEVMASASGAAPRPSTSSQPAWRRNDSGG